MEKLTQEELEQVKSLQTEISTILFDLGKNEADIFMIDNLKKELIQSKENTLSTLSKLNLKESELILNFKNKYGDVEINLEDGIID